VSLNVRTFGGGTVDKWDDLHAKIRANKKAYKKRRVQISQYNSILFRQCRHCGVIYYPTDFNAGYCPLCQLNEAWKLPWEEMLTEYQDRREESA
jgi:uncharacterized OB-fold protein